MKQIKALSKLEFDKLFSSEKFKIYDYACFISILDCDNNEQKYDHSIKNFLQVKMWDIEKTIKSNDKVYKKPSIVELRKIVKFVNKHKDKDIWIVHCSAGISRSGAVATFIKDKFINDIDKQNFYRENKFINPNLYILNKLKDLDK